MQIKHKLRVNIKSSLNLILNIGYKRTLMWLDAAFESRTESPMAKSPRT